MLQKIFNKFTDSENRADSLYHFTWKYINPWLRKLGMTLVAHHYYQTIPDAREAEVYKDNVRPLDMIDWQVEQQIAYTANLLSLYKDEFNNPAILNACGYSEGPFPFSSGEAEFYYSLIRLQKPKRIIEVGAGGSSLVCLAALKMNYAETGQRTDFISIEPFPGEEVLHITRQKYDFVNYKLIQSKLQPIDPKLFQTLKAGDILFVDSTHVYKQGSDVEYEFLRVYPHLQADVFVHIHDIFLPRDYPTAWNSKYYRFWNEQYHLETFLMYNNRFDIIAGLNMLHHEKPEIFFDNIKAYHKDRFPGSFWMKVKL